MWQNQYHFTVILFEQHGGAVVSAVTSQREHSIPSQDQQGAFCVEMACYPRISHSLNLYVRWTGDAKLALGVNVCLCVFVCLYLLPFECKDRFHSTPISWSRLEQAAQKNQWIVLNCLLPVISSSVAVRKINVCQNQMFKKHYVKKGQMLLKGNRRALLWKHALMLNSHFLAHIITPYPWTRVHLKSDRDPLIWGKWPLIVRANNVTFFFCF